MKLVLRHPILYNVLIVPIAYLIKPCRINNLFGLWLLQSSVGILTIDWGKVDGAEGKTYVPITRHITLTIRQLFLTFVPNVLCVAIQTRPMATKMGMGWSLCEYSTSNQCLHYLIRACDKRDNEWSHCIRTRIKHISDLHTMDDAFHICNKKVEHQFLSDVDMKRKKNWHQSWYTASRGFISRYDI